MTFNNRSAELTKLIGRNTGTLFPGDRVISKTTGERGIVSAVVGGKGGEPKVSVLSNDKMDNDDANKWLPYDEWVSLPRDIAVAAFDDYTGYVCKRGDKVEITNQRHGTIEEDSFRPEDQRAGSVVGTALNDVKQLPNSVLHLLVETNGNVETAEIALTRVYDVKVLFKASAARGFVPDSLKP